MNLPDLVQTFGPALLFVFAFFETAVLVGILVPSGTALAIAVALSLEGVVSLPVAVAASASGALLGDQAGYWTGRRGATRLLRAPGWIGRTLRRYETVTARLFHRHSALSVTLGRPISYVRTLMPITAGLNGMGWRRFVFFDTVGIVLWVALYIGLGLAGGRGWQWMAGRVGTGWALGAVGLLVLLWLFWRYRRPATTVSP